MKKKLLLILMFMTMFIVGNRSVYALECEVGKSDCTVDAIKEKIDSETKQLACVYVVRTEKGKKYYNYIYYNVVDDNFYASSTFNDKSELLQDDDSAWLLGDAYNQLYEKNSCPTHSYLDKYWVDEKCFDNDGECLSNGKLFNAGTDFNYTLSSWLEYDNIKNIGVSTENSCRYENIYGDYIDFNPSDNTMYAFMVEDGKKYFIDNTENFYTDSSHALYFYNFISGLNSCPSDIYILKKMDHYVDYYNFYNTKNNGDFKEKFNDGYDLIEYYCTSCDGESKSSGEGDGCEIISSSLRKTINDIMKIIRIAIPLLLIGLITYDFATAVFAGDDKGVNKAKNNAIKRIIIAVVIFFVPTLINLVFNLANEVWANANYEICGLDK